LVLALVVLVVMLVGLGLGVRLLLSLGYPLIGSHCGGRSTILLLLLLLLRLRLPSCIASGGCSREGGRVIPGEAVGGNGGCGGGCRMMVVEIGEGAGAIAVPL